ncbi:hypothetical protein ACRJ4W_10405 [Streptomyces sp. GLT-R25]
MNTTGSYADTSDGTEIGGQTDVKAGPSPTVTDNSSTQAQPLTIVVSDAPPPVVGSPEAAALLDGAGVDRAVVLGPAVAPDGTGRPVRAAVELTREGPDAPVQVRRLAGPPSAATPDGDADTAFPGANVLLPLADALGPAPVVDSGSDTQTTPKATVKTDSGPVDTPAARPKLVSDGTSLLDAKSVSNGVGPDSTLTTAPAAAKLATLSRPWTDTATDLYLESGNDEGTGTGGRAPGLGGGHGPGNGGTPPPPPATTDDTTSVDPAPDDLTQDDSASDNPTAAPPVVLPPAGRIIVRPADSGGTTDDVNGPARPAGDPVVTTLDGHKVPIAQLRRMVPSATVKPRPGRAVQTVTISQSPADDGTAHSAGRRALLDQDTFRGVRTMSVSPSPALAAETTSTASTTPANSNPQTVADPPVRRTVFTGPPTALPGSDTESGADYFTSHGTSRTVTLGTEDVARPTVKISGVQLGEVLKSWAQDRDRERPLVLFSCETGQQPKVAGLPVAQHVANRTGRPVYAPTTEVGTARDRDGNVRAVLAEGPDGPGSWRLFTPEPSGTDLDALARDAGLHAGPEPADAFAQARTLQQVRTLRDTLGTDAEQQQGNRELLAGLAYVDGLRWLSPDTAARYGDGRMTQDLLRRMVVDRAGATGTGIDPSAGPTVEQYTEFLRAAAELRNTAGPDTTLDALLPPPPPALPPTTMVSPQDVRGLSYAPSAQVTWSLSDTPLPAVRAGPQFRGHRRTGPPQARSGAHAEPPGEHRRGPDPPQQDHAGRPGHRAARGRPGLPAPGDPGRRELPLPRRPGQRAQPRHTPRLGRAERRRPAPPAQRPDQGVRACRRRGRGDPGPGPRRRRRSADDRHRRGGGRGRAEPDQSGLGPDRAGGRQRRRRGPVAADPPGRRLPEPRRRRSHAGRRTRVRHRGTDRRGGGAPRTVGVPLRRPAPAGPGPHPRPRPAARPARPAVAGDHLRHQPPPGRPGRHPAPGLQRHRPLRRAGAGVGPAHPRTGPVPHTASGHPGPGAPGSGHPGPGRLRAVRGVAAQHGRGHRPGQLRHRAPRPGRSGAAGDTARPAPSGPAAHRAGRPDARPAAAYRHLRGRHPAAHRPDQPGRRPR